MMVGYDGEAAMGTPEQPLLGRDMPKSRIPDEGPVTEDPMGRCIVQIVHRHNLNRNLGKLAGQGNCAVRDRSHATLWRPGFTGDEWRQLAMMLWSAGLRR